MRALLSAAPLVAGSSFRFNRSTDVHMSAASSRHLVMDALGSCGTTGAHATAEMTPYTDCVRGRASINRHGRNFDPRPTRCKCQKSAVHVIRYMLGACPGGRAHQARNTSKHEECLQEGDESEGSPMITRAPETERELTYIGLALLSRVCCQNKRSSPLVCEGGEKVCHKSTPALRESGPCLIEPVVNPSSQDVLRCKMKGGKQKYKAIPSYRREHHNLDPRTVRYAEWRADEWGRGEKA